MTSLDGIVHNLLFLNTGQKHYLWEALQGSGLSLQLSYTGRADFFTRIFLPHRPCHMMNFAVPHPSKVQFQLARAIYWDV